MKLPPRLAKVAEFIPAGKVVADIGTDHALLPLYLLEKGISPGVIAVEAGIKPFRRAENSLCRHPLGSRVVLRLGSGLQALGKEDGVEAAVIAGMGSATIRDILSRKPPELAELKLFILQPMSRPEELRSWLPQKGFRVVDESLVKDDGRIYEVFLVLYHPEAGCPDSPFGVRLREKKDPLLEEYVAVKINKTKVILKNLDRTGRKDADDLRRKFTGRLLKLERLMELVSQGR